jgi:predicted nucleotidyltransferase
VSKVVLYGSFAKDLSQPKSKTMDILIIIKDSNNLNVEGFVERTIYFNELLKDSVIPVDCLVYTESEYQKLMNVLI